MPARRLLAHYKIDHERNRLLMVACNAEDMLLPRSNFTFYGLAPHPLRTPRSKPKSNFRATICFQFDRSLTLTTTPPAEFDAGFALVQKRKFVLPDHLFIHDWAFTDNHYVLLGNRIKLDIPGTERELYSPPRQLADLKSFCFMSMLGGRVTAGADGHAPDDRRPRRGPEPAVDAGVPAAALPGGRRRWPRLERARRGADADVVDSRRQRLRGARRRPGRRHHRADPNVRLLLPVVPLPQDVRLRLAQQEAGPVLHERRQGQGVAASPCPGDQTLWFLLLIGWYLPFLSNKQMRVEFFFTRSRCAWSFFFVHSEFLFITVKRICYCVS